MLWFGPKTSVVAIAHGHPGCDIELGPGVTRATVALACPHCLVWKEGADFGRTGDAITTGQARTRRLFLSGNSEPAAQDIGEFAWRRAGRQPTKAAQVVREGVGGRKVRLALRDQPGVMSNGDPFRDEVGARFVGQRTFRLRFITSRLSQMNTGGAARRNGRAVSPRHGPYGTGRVAVRSG